MDQLVQRHNQFQNNGSIKVRYLQAGIDWIELFFSSRFATLCAGLRREEWIPCASTCVETPGYYQSSLRGLLCRTYGARVFVRDTCLALGPQFRVFQTSKTRRG
jgi:hypothetical protein